jgi:SAM-dependent methyltransferase
VTARGWDDVQREHYDARPHRHLLPSEGGRYADNLVATLWNALGVGADAAGVEIGCGAGRFTLPLLTRCGSLDAVDLSRRQLDVLAGELGRHGVAPERCRLHEARAEDLTGVLPAGRADFLAGVFILHHLADPEGAVARLVRLIRPGGRVAFLEPNRWNPLFLLQIACCPDMTWREERLLYRLGSRRLVRVLTGAGLVDVRLGRHGFFPPQIVNRIPGAIGVERALERVPPLRPVLPFLVVSGTVPDTPAGRT